MSFQRKGVIAMANAPQDAPHPAYVVRPATVADVEERAA